MWRVGGKWKFEKYEDACSFARQVQKKNNIFLEVVDMGKRKNGI